MNKAICVVLGAAAFASGLCLGSGRWLIGIAVGLVALGIFYGVDLTSSKKEEPK